MFVNTLTRRFLFNLIFLLVVFSIYFNFFYKIYVSDTVIFSFAIHPFNLCEKYPEVWFHIKLLYIPISFMSTLIVINIIYSCIFNKSNLSKETSDKPNSNLYISILHDNNKIITIPESGLYQNFLITGTIGSGKTSSVMYPFTRQLIKYKFDDNKKKLGMLILDVKGNYYSQVTKYANYYNRTKDLIIIEIRTVILNIIPLTNLI